MKHLLESSRLILLIAILIVAAACGDSEASEAPAEEAAAEEAVAEEAVEEPAEEPMEEVAVEESAAAEVAVEGLASEAVLAADIAPELASSEISLSELPLVTGPITGLQIDNITLADDQLLIAQAMKPPITIDRLPQLSGYSVDKLATDRVIGSAGVDGSVGLTVSPIRELEIAQYQDVNRGIALGQVWSYAADQQQPGNYLVALDTATLDGYMFNEALGQEIAIDFERETLRPQSEVAYEEAPPVDVTIRSDGTCFLLKEQSGVNRYCSFDPLLSTRSLLGPDYVARLEEEVFIAMEKLAEAAILLPDENEVLVERAISEMENPQAIAQCHPEDPASCVADIIVAPILTNTSAFTPDYLGDGMVTARALLVLREDLDLSDIEFSDPYLDEMGVEAIRFLPAGDYVLYDYTIFDSEASGMLVSGRDMNDQIIDLAPLPSRLAPFVNPDGDVGIVEIAGFKVTRWCVMWECS